MLLLLTRREFLYASVLVFGARALVRARRVRLLAVVPVEACASLRNGLAFGGEEAAHTAALFGVVVTCDIVAHDERQPPAGTLARALGAGADGMVSAVPGAAMLLAAADRGLVVLDVAAAGPLSRSATPGGWRVFHVRPTAGAQRASAAAPALWHATLDRYGAEQLNERYERRFGVRMDSTAWAGWFAVKALAETALRVPDGAGGDALAAALARTGFDGHKGRSLSFDPATGVLRQPLYELGRDADGREAVVREIPPDPRPRDS